MSIDHEIRVKVLWEKESLEKLRLSKDEVPKWTRAVDSRRTHEKRSAILEKSHSGRIRGVLDKKS
jgi:hypothetical protein